MSFLQPWMLFALPVAALPVVVHLINQRRYRTTQWGAMRFLMAAQKANRGYAKIRQWLILLLRTLVIAAAVVAVGRPLAGGVLGRIGGGAAEAIVVVDRSPSMQTRIGPGGPTALQAAVGQVAATVETLGTTSVWLIESDREEPALLAEGDLAERLTVGPSDATADVPAMILAAAEAIEANQMGQTDVWIASDLRRSDWRPEDGRWASIRQTLEPIADRVRFRLLRATGGGQADLGVRVERASWVGGAEPSVELSIVVTSTGGEARSVPMAVDLNGSRSTVSVDVSGTRTAFTHRLPVPRDEPAGWGSLSLPTDRNAGNDMAYFAFDQPPVRKTIVVTGDAEVGRVMTLAAGASPAVGVESVAEVVSPSAVGGIAWEEIALLVWHAGLGEEDRAAVEAFVGRGGVVLFLPGGGGVELGGVGFGGVKFGGWGGGTNGPGGRATVGGWRGDSGLLAASAAGQALPVGELSVMRHVEILGEGTPIATLVGGDPLLVRAATDAGGVYFLGTTPRATDSSLAADGVVLYVMVQRAIAQGAESLSSVRWRDAGEVDPGRAAGWIQLAGPEDRTSIDAAFSAGVYRDRSELGRGRTFALNRSAAEDEPAVVSDAEIDVLFGELAVDRIEADGPAGSLFDEVWRACLIATLLAAVGEAFLCLPRATHLGGGSA